MNHLVNTALGKTVLDADIEEKDARLVRVLEPPGRADSRPTISYSYCCKTFNACERRKKRRQRHPATCADAGT